MPDRLPSLVLLVGFWIPPALVGRAAADLVHRSTTRIRPALNYTLLTTFVLGWSAAWFLFNLSRMPPYLPGATQDPTYAPPEAVAGLAVVASARVGPSFLFERAGRCYWDRGCAPLLLVPDGRTWWRRG